MSGLRVDREQGATFVELFFDLVFVYAITQLTAFVLHDLTWAGVGRALLLFWLVWWAWTQFTWTLNTADTEHVLVRLPTLAATAVAFFLAQAIPDAFDGAGAWFAISYVLVRLIGLGLQEWVLRADRASEVPLLNVWTLSSMVGLGLVIAGGFADGGLRLALWAAAPVADMASAALAGRGTWDIAVGHFAERHGLIVIIALGESLIAAGVATSELTRDVAFAAATSGAVVAACALWWTYFAVLQVELEERLAAQEPRRLAAFARDVFSLWHAVVVAGVIGIAVGFEKAISHPDEPLSAAASLALTSGVVLFVGGLAGAAQRARVRGVVGPRLVLVVLALAATPVIPRLSPAVVLWSVAVGVALLAVVETRRVEGSRGQVAPA